MIYSSLVAACLLALVSAGQACDVNFDCAHRTATVDGKKFSIVCGTKTGENGDGTLTSVIRASGPWRRGLVAPGTPMIATNPRLCYDCFIHVGGGGPGAKSLGCIGISPSGFNTLKSCVGSKFTIARR